MYLIGVPLAARFASVKCSHQLHRPFVAVRTALETVLTRMRQTNETVKHLSCGAVSAIVSRTVVAPLERVKMEVILNHQHRNQWPAAVGHIWTTGGTATSCSCSCLGCSLVALVARDHTPPDMLTAELHQRQ